MNLLAIIAMSLEFLIAPQVEPGDIPLASDMAGLANAANVKDRSGLGDFHYRLCDYCINWARQIRNSDETGNTPSMGEYWEVYAYLNPKNDIPTFPVAGPGEPEGSNATCPPVVYQYGNVTANLDDEETRLGAVDLWFGLARPAQTLEEWWEVAKRQRGVYDPFTGEQNVPVIEAARAVQNVFWNTGIPHGKTTGGFFPTPIKLLDDCGGSDGFPIPSYQIKFTALKDGVFVPPNHGTVSTDADGRSVITYSGTCPWNTTLFGGNDVQDISRGSRYFVVVFLDGIDVLPTSDWIEGPYTGEGELTRYNAEHFSRAAWAFINDFRGTEGQRNPDSFDIQKIAFDFEAFFGKQYHLSPNIGFDNGIELDVAYPTATASGAFLTTGTPLKFNGQDGHSYFPGFVFTGCFAKATNLSSPVTVEVLNDKSVIASLLLTPEQPQALIYIPDAVVPSPLKVRLATDAHFSSPGTISFEANEILNYKPDHWDAAMLLRLAATIGGDENDTSPFIDGGGVLCDRANGIYKDYQRLGCVVNTNTAGVRSVESALNESPVYDAHRRVLNSLFRMVRRQELLSYETDSQGRPIIRAKRYAFGLKNIKADLFEGIAPSYNGVDSVVEGVEYIVRSHSGGSIVYGGRKFTHQQRFIGSGISTFDTNGDALLLEYEGIRPIAAKKGWTNEWLMSEEFHFEHPSPSSLWYPDHYADWYVRGNRCHTYAFSLPAPLTAIADIPVYPTNDPTFRQLHLSPELPSGYNYSLGANASASADFCSSCPIYKAPYEIESATVEFDAGGNDVVRLVFKASFQHDPSAPTTFGPDPLTWDMAAVRAEPYRTTDNGLREYFYYLATGTHGSWKVGDGAYRQNGGIAGLQSLDDKPFGCIFPRLFFTSLVKKPYLDGNDILDDHDTRITMDELFKLEIKLKCWCEGAVDEFSSVNNICGGGSKPFDFTYENLKFKAFGGGTIGKGHGPVANTVLDANTFNQIAACLDELYIFRVEGLMEFQARSLNYSTTIDAAPQWGSGVCPPGASVAAIYEGTPPSPVLTSTGGWGPVGFFTASSGAALFVCGPSASGSQDLGLQASKNDIEYRYAVVSGFENAIPPNLQDLIDNRNIGVIGTIVGSTDTPRKETTTNFADTACSPGTGGGPGAFWNGSDGYKFVDDHSDHASECVLLSNGKFDAGAAPAGSFSVCTYPDASSGSGFDEVSGSSNRSLTFTALNDAGSAIIVVPMVEPEVYET
jgi:hypothetical protein